MYAKPGGALENVQCALNPVSPEECLLDLASVRFRVTTRVWILGWVLVIHKSQLS